jgi:hypothetical protein
VIVESGCFIAFSRARLVLAFFILKTTHVTDHPQDAVPLRLWFFRTQQFSGPGQNVVGEAVEQDDHLLRRSSTAPNLMN